MAGQVAARDLAVLAFHQQRAVLLHDLTRLRVGLGCGQLAQEVVGVRMEQDRVLLDDVLRLGPGTGVDELLEGAQEFSLVKGLALRVFLAEETIEEAHGCPCCE